MEQAQENYLLEMLPYARIAGSSTGIPAELVAAMWSWETDFGTNASSKYNNEGGIKANSPGKDGVAPGGVYAAYNSLGNFAKDWARILHIRGYGYPEVLAAAAAGSTWETIVEKFNASQYAQQDYDVTTIVSRAKWLQANAHNSAQGGGSAPSGNVAGYSNAELMAIGAAAVALLAAAGIKRLS